METADSPTAGWGFGADLAGFSRRYRELRWACDHGKAATCDRIAADRKSEARHIGEAVRDEDD
jgi:hypothetical protein